MSGNLHLVRPYQASSTGVSTSPISITVQASALFQLLEFTIRSQDGNRVIGTLVGTRSDDGSEIDIKDAYIVPHREEGDEVTIEEYHHKAQYQLHKRSNPKDSILGWFSTLPTIDSFSALVHDFYSRSVDGSHSHSAIHLTLDSGSEIAGEIKQIPTINTYIASTIGAIGATAAKLKLDKGSSYIFTPIPNKVIFDASESTVLNFASKVSDDTTESIEFPSKSVDLNSLVDHLNKIELLINSTLKYIERVENKEIEGDEEFAKFLLSNLNSNADKINIEELGKSFNSHIQDTLMIEYLTSSIKTQLELSAKLTTLI